MTAAPDGVLAALLDPTPAPPLLAQLTDDELAAHCDSWRGVGLMVRVVRGRKMRTEARLFDEFAAAWQFPLWFGENRDGFEECLREPERYPERGAVLVVTEPDQVLADEAASPEWLVGVLASVSQEWSHVVDDGEWWDRPALAFHTVLISLGDTAALARQWGISPG